jgi:hypothetical protein
MAYANHKMWEKRTNSRKPPPDVKRLQLTLHLILSHVNISSEREEVVLKAIGTWAFSAHEFTDDELLFGASVMLQHALTIPELDQWRMPAGEYMFLNVRSRLQ